MDEVNNKKDLSGKKFGRWTVLDQCVPHGRYDRKWLCRCECGTERFVMERSLIYGNSQSCGCLTRERAKAAVTHDLTGKTFGEFTVLGRDGMGSRNGNVYWLCRCSCGKEVSVAGTLLVCGRKTSCGCKTEYHYASKDIRGQRFHRLVAQYPTEKRAEKGFVVWHCLCDCGNEIDVSYNSLVYCNMKSCGCQKKENDRKLYQNLARVDGTSLDTFRNNKIPANNTTGVRGVYLIRGKYTAKIVFQKKAYYLGTYDRIEEAAAARKAAEDIICGEAVVFYDKWKAKAIADPAWAEENPIKFNVFKTQQGLQIQMLPVMD